MEMWIESQNKRIGSSASKSFYWIYAYMKKTNKETNKQTGFVGFLKTVIFRITQIVDCEHFCVNLEAKSLF